MEAAQCTSRLCNHTLPEDGAGVEVEEEHKWHSEDAVDGDNMGRI